MGIDTINGSKTRQAYYRYNHDRFSRWSDSCIQLGAQYGKNMEFQKVRNNLPSYNFKAELVHKVCICERKRDDKIVCGRCNQFFVGRLSQPCPKHPEVIFLMDARQCAFCGASVAYLQVSKQ